MIRYAIQYNDGGQLTWEAIGKGRSPDIQEAHLYTKRDLAEAKVRQYVKADWFKRMFKEGKAHEPIIVEFECTVITPDK